MTQPPANMFSSRHIPIVEEEYYLGDETAETISHARGPNRRPVGTLEEAMQLVLSQARSMPPPRSAASRPAGGRDRKEPERHRGITRFEKPCNLDQLTAALERYFG